MLFTLSVGLHNVPLAPEYVAKASPPYQVSIKTILNSMNSSMMFDITATILSRVINMSCSYWNIEIFILISMKQQFPLISEIHCLLTTAG